LLMLPPSLPLWQHLPELRFLQFPWRWLVALDVPFAIFLAAAIGSSRRARVGYVVLAVLVAAAATAMIRDAWWDTGDLEVVEASIRSNHGYEGTEEYTPLGCDPSALPGVIAEPESADIFDQTAATPPIQRFDPESIEITDLGGAHVAIDR